MNNWLGWFLVGGLALFVLAPLAAGLDERRRRRRDEALGSRRKDKIRL